MHCCFKLSLTLILESQAVQALLYVQKALVVAWAAKLQGSSLYASLVDTIVNICANRKVSPGDLGFRHGEHAIPYEGFIAAAHGQLQHRSQLALNDTFIREHTCWVKELQAELVRCDGLPDFHMYCSHL